MNLLRRVKVFKIASDLNLPGSSSSSKVVIQYCEQRVRGFFAILADCSISAELHDIAVRMLKAKFECTSDLMRISMLLARTIAEEERSSVQKVHRDRGRS